MARPREREPASAGTGAKRSWARLAAALVSIGYVALVAARHEGRFGLGSLGLSAAALALGWLSARARAPLAWAAWGAGVVTASLGSDGEAMHLASAGGALACALAGAVALPSVASLGGVLRAPRRSPRLGVAMLVVLWAPTLMAVGARVVGSRAASGSSMLAPWALVGAASTSVLVLMAMAAAARLERRLDLGVVPRLDAFLVCAAASVVAAVVAVIGDVLAPLPAAAAMCATTGVALCVTTRLGDPVVWWQQVRRAAALAAMAVALTAIFVFVAGNDRVHERALAAGFVLLALAAGAELPRIARAVRGEGNRRLAAVRAARDALRGKDAGAALGAALHALRDASPAIREVPRPEEGRLPSAELWTLDPVRCLRVDAAGYPHDEPATLPPELVLVGCAEPESTLRAEVLDAVEVRRPDLRPLSQWMRDARMATATMVARDGEIEGVLLLPAHDGAPDLTLEEARALRELADDLAPLCHARAQLARSMDREQRARVLADDATTRAERLEHEVARGSAHHALAATRLARPAAVGIYSAASRAAYDALDRLAKAQAPAVVVARSGVDPVPFLARAHLAGARGTAPLVLVDCTSTREHDLERWRDPIASPLALADGGVLVLVDAAALPTDVQRLVGQALAERRAPWERPDALDIVLALTAVEDPRALADAGRLDTLLASRVGAALDAPVRLPGIEERPEDIRALVTDRLAREGLRVRGAPVGMEDAAFALLVDHPFEGEDAELAALVQKLVARARGEVVREQDVRAVLAEPAHQPRADQLVAGAAGVISPKPSRRRP
jgi:hypothetical protein